jgi:ribosome-associated protein
MKGTDNAHTDDLMEFVIEGLMRKKGKKIVTLDLSGIENAICQYFVIAHGHSTTQTEALGESVQEVISEKLHSKPFHKEGFENAQWILLDYGDIIVHIFLDSFRTLYNLEDLWADAEYKLIEEAV